MSSEPLRRFVAYQRRVYRVTPVMCASIVPPKRFLIGVPKSAIAQKGSPSEADEKAFRQAWKTELSDAFRKMFQAPAIEEEFLITASSTVSGDWEEPLVITPSHYCIWEQSNSVNLR